MSDVYRDLQELITDTFAPYRRTVVGTEAREQELLRLRALLNPIVTMAQTSGGFVATNEYARGLVGQMRRVVLDQVEAVKSAQAWDPRRTPWCVTHWNVLQLGIAAGTHSGILGTAALMSEFIQVLSEQGMLATQDPTTLNTLRVQHSPLCCFLGDDRMVAVYAAARLPNTSTLETADETVGP